jgi:hypothetical protein
VGSEHSQLTLLFSASLLCCSAFPAPHTEFVNRHPTVSQDPLVQTHKYTTQFNPVLTPCVASFVIRTLCAVGPNLFWCKFLQASAG